jgi:hypothetical protein
MGYAALRAERVARARATAERHRWANAAQTFFCIYDEIARARRADAITPIFTEAQ